MDIEKRSFEIISGILAEEGVVLDPENEPVIKRVIHTTADFEYVNNLVFSENAVKIGIEALKSGCDIVTDTQMAKAGISKAALSKLGGEVRCFMSDDDVAAEAKARGVTRAAVSMEKAAKLEKPLIFAIGNAPTALIALDELMREGRLSPKLIIGVPVGFVNVVESKELIIASSVPHIVARGRKGGSNVAAAIVNAMLYRITR
ncbi:MAG: precorrin-8X methylmutase [Clostridia bacterium]|jgi:precorrin-8X/cobalt-precorrin-8 methylmutase|nr:precorrin-8X methylmutase [Clostridia bacterium]